MERLTGNSMNLLPGDAAGIPRLRALAQGILPLSC